MNLARLLLVLIMLFPEISKAQDHALCPGNYRVQEEGTSSKLEKIYYDSSDQRFHFDEIRHYANFRLNALAYSSLHGRFFCLNLGQPLQLISLDPNFILQVEKDLKVPDGLLFVSADIDTRNHHMYVLGYSNTEEGSLLLDIDLSAGHFPTRLLPVSEKIACADLVYDPASGQMIGYDHQNGQLVALDIGEHLVKVNPLVTDPSPLAGGVPSLFFDQSQTLYGIGSTTLESTFELFRFEPESGAIYWVQDLGHEQNQDACFCPPLWFLTNRVAMRQNGRCNLIHFKVKISNNFNQPWETIQLTDTFPEGFIIEALSSEDSFDVIHGGVSFSHYSIEPESGTGMDFTLDVLVRPTTSVKSGSFYDQPRIKTPEGVIYSDDPETLTRNDATRFMLLDQIQVRDTIQIVICDDETFTLRPPAPQGMTITWDSGLRAGSRVISTDGFYLAMAENACSDYAFIYHVMTQDISVDLGLDLELFPFDDFELTPKISGTPGKHYTWYTTDSRLPLCATCHQQQLVARTDAEIGVTVTTDGGCQASDRIFIKVSDSDIFAPNAISPNADGRNDQFYLYSGQDFFVEKFEVYNRWGNLVSSVQKRIPGQLPLWDGTQYGRQLNPGVYVWRARVRKKDGTTDQLSGEIHLIR